MNKRHHLLWAVCIVLSTPNVVHAGVPDTSPGQPSTTKLPVTVVNDATDGQYNYRCFEVEAPSAGEYFAEFWALPARHADNTLSSYTVYVNDCYAGAIKPTAGNWQSCGLEGDKTITLKKGTNTVSVATRSPECPEIETLKVARNPEDAAFSAKAYEDYLQAAARQTDYGNGLQKENAIYEKGANGAGMEHFTNVPLNYTFYKTFSFTKGQEIFISTASRAPHKLDIVYFGSESKFTVYPVGSDSDLSAVPGESPANGHAVNRSKGLISYTPATSEEMQGLSYMYPSEPAKNSSMHIASHIVPISKTGQYLIRVRHDENGQTALANITVNGEYYYEDIPISLSYKECGIPADGHCYASFTCSRNPGADDPFLFVHGAAADKIVGFNDDGPSEKTTQYGLSEYDSYLCQQYMFPTCGISVSNYSSNNPVSLCNIIACIPQDPAIAPGTGATLGLNAADDSGNEADGIIGEHEYVDLGLPSGTLWATCNLGATSPYENGDYYAWGETEPREDFTLENYAWIDGYTEDSDGNPRAVFKDLGYDICGTQYDAARAQWGYGWRLPNEEERYELRRICWGNQATQENGVWGTRMHGPNGHTIFLPMSSIVDNPVFHEKTTGLYWTGVEEPRHDANPDPDVPSYSAKSFAVDRFFNGTENSMSPKNAGLSVRPVTKRNISGISGKVSEDKKVCIAYRDGTVTVTGTSGEGTVSVMDVSGRVFSSTTLTDGACRLTDLSKGIYFIIYSEKGAKDSTLKITI